MVFKFFFILIIFGWGFSYNTRYGSELYQDGKNARNSALGGVSMSYADGSNPVLLKNKKIPSIHFSHKNKFGGLVQITILSYFHPGKKHPVYIGLTNRLVNNIPDTRLAWVDNGNFFPESGEIDYFNIHEIDQQEIGIQLSTIRLWGPYTLGFNIKPSFTILAESISYGINFDVATMLQLIDKLDVMLRMEDIIGLEYWDSGTVETISPMIMGGMNYHLSNLRLGLEIGSRIESKAPLHYHMGIEYEQQDQLSFRLGTSHSNQFTAGFGIQLSLVDFNYAYLHPDQGSPFEGSHIISTGINLDKLNWIKGEMAP